MQIGRKFIIFQDRDIAWGHNWRERIDHTLDAVTLLIPTVTPAFFESSQCRREVERFLDRESQLRRSDLILPIYYVSTPAMDEPTRREADHIARQLASQQYADWRELRFEPLTSAVVRARLAELAKRMRDQLLAGGQDEPDGTQ